MSIERKNGFHGYYDHNVWPRFWNGKKEIILKHYTAQERTLSYSFYPHLHPYVSELVRRLLSRSVRGLLDADTATPALEDKKFFKDRYHPSQKVVSEPHPIKDLDFTSSGAYAAYNWELFFHVPFTIALHLSKNQRFEDAQKWFHYIFDPTDDSDGLTPARFWKVKPFRTTDVESIEQLLLNLSTGEDEKLRDETITAIDAWKDSPFRPHLVARYRPAAYMMKTVMAYLDNLIAWGDSLFRQDTVETLNEATQLYVLAANLLGPRPQPVPKKREAKPKTYADLRASLNEFGDALVDLESELPLDGARHPGQAADSDGMTVISSIGKTLYFCVPRNDKLLGYWDTVADRLFKIRNSLNLQGVFRKLPLFEPPIDPALLARAVAAGVDISKAISGEHEPPLVRFSLLVQKAAEICQEVKALGGHLLSAIEKEDNEALSILRAKHERVILTLAESVRYGQWQEAIKSREALERSLSNAAQRYTYYERLLGKKASEITLPGLDPLDEPGLLKGKLKADEPEVETQPIEIELGSNLIGGGGHKLISEEEEELGQLEEAQHAQDNSAKLEAIGAFLNMLPQVSLDFKPIGIGVGLSMGGSNIAALFQGLAAITRLIGGRRAHEATMAGKMGFYTRREQEWANQSNAIAGEFTQILKQLRAAQIREAVSKREWQNHQQQIKHAEEIEAFLSDERTRKTSNQALYAWMKREARSLYTNCYELAFDVAQKAERALRYELGKPEASFIGYSYQAGKEGLFAGEKLYLDIKRMEVAYHDLNAREYELTKHVSLRELDPGALILLRATGRCDFSLPEELFDMDGPGHYFRRIRSVAISIPCVAGPYTSVNCALTLNSSAIRKSSVAEGKYAYEDKTESDARFEVRSGLSEQVVTSSGQHDSGLFETNLRDERLLPFEGHGVISTWSLKLPANPSANEPEPCQFNYDTISDIVLHVRYTAREGGNKLRGAAMMSLTKHIKAAQAAGSTRLFSVRHDFPAAWAKFKHGAANPLAELTLELTPEHYPFWSRSLLGAVKGLDLFAKTSKTKVKVADSADGTGKIDTLGKNDVFGGLRTGTLGNVPRPAPIGKWTLYLDDNTMEDLFIALRWGE